MSDNRGKTIEDCVVEREAEYAWLKHLTDPADIKRCRQRITHLGNRSQKLNEKGREGIEVATRMPNRRDSREQHGSRDHRRTQAP